MSVQMNGKKSISPSVKIDGSEHRNGSGPKARVSGDELAAIFSTQLSAVSNLMFEHLRVLSESRSTSDVPEDSSANVASLHSSVPQLPSTPQPEESQAQALA